MSAAVAKTVAAASEQALFESALRLGDNALVLGQRLCEWTSNGPTVELDIALTNHALDMIGQARMFLTYAGQVEGAGRDEDALAYLRSPEQFRNVLMVEQPNGDFARTMARQFLFALHAHGLFEAMSASRDERFAGIAGKAVKEMAYHARHAGEWVVRLGDGTEESHTRMSDGLAFMWPYAHELFDVDAIDEEMIAAGVIADARKLKAPWRGQVQEVLARAGLEVPDDDWRPVGGRRGRHSEHLSYILGEMQALHRAHPGVEW